MAFERPTLTELYQQAEASIKANLPDADLSLRRSNLKVLSILRAGADHLQFGYLTRMAQQIFVHQAETEYLEDLAANWGVRRKAATAASGNAEFTGTPGAVVPAGTQLRRADNARYQTIVEVTLAGASTTVAVEAVVAGYDGNALADTPLALTSYIHNVDSVAMVDASGLNGGADQEEDTSLRARALYRIQNPPKGGADSDYVRWALEVAGVTRAYCYPERLGSGTVGVTVLMDDTEGGPVPTPGDVARVQGYIDEVDDTGYPFRRPVTAAVTVFALIPAPLDFTISLSPDTDAVKAAVEAELADLIRREAEPEGALLISHIREAISIAAGETDHVLTSPTANVTTEAGEIITMGEITWS